MSEKKRCAVRIVELWGFSNLEDSEVISEFYIALKSNCLVRDTSQQ